MKKFKDISDKLKKYKSHNMYSIKSTTKTKKIYKYDQSQNINIQLVLDKKLKNLDQYEEYGIEPYDVEFYEKECVEVITVDKLSWGEIENAINNLSITNNNSIKPKEINTQCDLVVNELFFEDGTKAYILNKHTTMGSAFKNRIVFSGSYKLNEDEILSFSEYGDVVIVEGNCYILHEDKFNSIFKFREKLDSEVEKAKDQIENWKFIDDSASFYNECNKNYNTKRAIVKALNKKGLYFLENATPEQIMDKIKKHKELDELSFDDNKKMVVTPESTKIILRILTNQIGLDLFTESIFGTEEKNDDNEIS